MAKKRSHKSKTVSKPSARLQENNTVGDSGESSELSEVSSQTHKLSSSDIAASEVESDDISLKTEEDPYKPLNVKIRRRSSIEVGHPQDDQVARDVVNPEDSTRAAVDGDWALSAADARGKWPEISSKESDGLNNPREDGGKESKVMAKKRSHKSKTVSKPSARHLQQKNENNTVGDSGESSELSEFSSQTHKLSSSDIATSEVGSDALSLKTEEAPYKPLLVRIRTRRSLEDGHSQDDQVSREVVNLGDSTQPGTSSPKWDWELSAARGQQPENSTMETEFSSDVGQTVTTVEKASKETKGKGPPSECDFDALYEFNYEENKGIQIVEQPDHPGLTAGINYEHDFKGVQQENSEEFVFVFDPADAGREPPKHQESLPDSERVIPLTGKQFVPSMESSDGNLQEQPSNQMIYCYESPSVMQLNVGLKHHSGAQLDVGFYSLVTEVLDELQQNKITPQNMDIYIKGNEKSGVETLYDLTLLPTGCDPASQTGVMLVEGDGKPEETGVMLMEGDGKPGETGVMLMEGDGKPGETGVMLMEGDGKPGETGVMLMEGDGKLGETGVMLVEGESKQMCENVIPDPCIHPDMQTDTPVNPNDVLLIVDRNRINFSFAHETSFQEEGAGYMQLETETELVQTCSQPCIDAVQERGTPAKGEEVALGQVPTEAIFQTDCSNHEREGDLRSELVQENSGQGSAREMTIGLQTTETSSLHKNKDKTQQLGQQSRLVTGRTMSKKVRHKVQRRGRQPKRTVEILSQKKVCSADETIFDNQSRMSEVHLEPVETYSAPTQDPQKVDMHKSTQDSSIQDVAWASDEAKDHTHNEAMSDRGLPKRKGVPRNRTVAWIPAQEEPDVQSAVIDHKRDVDKQLETVWVSVPLKVLSKFSGEKKGLQNIPKTRLLPNESERKVTGTHPSPTADSSEPSKVKKKRKPIKMVLVLNDGGAVVKSNTGCENQSEVNLKTRDPDSSGAEGYRNKSKVKKTKKSSHVKKEDQRQHVEAQSDLVCDTAMIRKAHHSIQNFLAPMRRQTETANEKVVRDQSLMREDQLESCSSKDPCNEGKNANGSPSIQDSSLQEDEKLCQEVETASLVKPGKKGPPKGRHDKSKRPLIITTVALIHAEAEPSVSGEVHNHKDMDQLLETVEASVPTGVSNIVSENENGVQNIEKSCREENENDQKGAEEEASRRADNILREMMEPVVGKENRQPSNSVVKESDGREEVKDKAGGPKQSEVQLETMEQCSTGTKCVHKISKRDSISQNMQESVLKQKDESEQMAAQSVGSTGRTITKKVLRNVRTRWSPRKRPRLETVQQCTSGTEGRDNISGIENISQNGQKSFENERKDEEGQPMGAQSDSSASRTRAKKVLCKVQKRGKPQKTRQLEKGMRCSVGTEGVDKISQTENISQSRQKSIENERKDKDGQPMEAQSDSSTGRTRAKKVLGNLPKRRRPQKRQCNVHSQGKSSTANETVICNQVNLTPVDIYSAPTKDPHNEDDNKCSSQSTHDFTKLGSERADVETVGNLKLNPCKTIPEKSQHEVRGEIGPLKITAVDLIHTGAEPSAPGGVQDCKVDVDQPLEKVEASVPSRVPSRVPENESGVQECCLQENGNEKKATDAQTCLSAGGSRPQASETEKKKGQSTKFAIKDSDGGGEVEKEGSGHKQGGMQLETVAPCTDTTKLLSSVTKSKSNSRNTNKSTIQKNGGRDGQAKAPTHLAPDEAGPLNHQNVQRYRPSKKLVVKLTQGEKGKNDVSQGADGVKSTSECEGRKRKLSEAAVSDDSRIKEEKAAEDISKGDSKKPSRVDEVKKPVTTGSSSSESTHDLNDNTVSTMQEGDSEKPGRVEEAKKPVTTGSSSSESTHDLNDNTVSVIQEDNVTDVASEDMKEDINRHRRVVRRRGSMEHGEEPSKSISCTQVRRPRAPVVKKRKKVSQWQKGIVPKKGARRRGSAAVPAQPSTLTNDTNNMLYQLLQNQQLSTFSGEFRQRDGSLIKIEKGFCSGEEAPPVDDVQEASNRDTIFKLLQNDELSEFSFRVPQRRGTWIKIEKRQPGVDNTDSLKSSSEANHQRQRSGSETSPGPSQQAFGSTNKNSSVNTDTEQPPDIESIKLHQEEVGQSLCDSDKGLTEAAAAEENGSDEEEQMPQLLPKMQPEPDVQQYGYFEEYSASVSNVVNNIIEIDSGKCHYIAGDVAFTNPLVEIGSHSLFGYAETRKGGEDCQQPSENISSLVIQEVNALNSETWPHAAVDIPEPGEELLGPTGSCAEEDGDPFNSNYDDESVPIQSPCDQFFTKTQSHDSDKRAETSLKSATPSHQNKAAAEKGSTPVLTIKLVPLEQGLLKGNPELMAALSNGYSCNPWVNNKKSTPDNLSQPESVEDSGEWESSQGKVDVVKDAQPRDNASSEDQGAQKVNETDLVKEAQPHDNATSRNQGGQKVNETDLVKEAQPHDNATSRNQGGQKVNETDLVKEAQPHDNASSQNQGGQKMNGTDLVKEAQPRDNASSQNQGGQKMKGSDLVKEAQPRDNASSEDQGGHKVKGPDPGPEMLSVSEPSRFAKEALVTEAVSKSDKKKETESLIVSLKNVGPRRKASKMNESADSCSSTAIGNKRKKHHTDSKTTSHESTTSKRPQDSSQSKGAQPKKRKKKVAGKSEDKIKSPKCKEFSIADRLFPSRERVTHPTKRSKPRPSAGSTKPPTKKVPQTRDLQQGEEMKQVSHKLSKSERYEGGKAVFSPRSSKSGKAPRDLYAMMRQFSDRALQDDLDEHRYDSVPPLFSPPYHPSEEKSIVSPIATSSPVKSSHGAVDTLIMAPELEQPGHSQDLREEDFQPDYDIENEEDNIHEDQIFVDSRFMQELNLSAQTDGEAGMPGMMVDVPDRGTVSPEGLRTFTYNPCAVSQSAGKVNVEVSESPESPEPEVTPEASVHETSSANASLYENLMDQEPFDGVGNDGVDVCKDQEDKGDMYRHGDIKEDEAGHLDDNVSCSQQFPKVEREQLASAEKRNTSFFQPDTPGVPSEESTSNVSSTEAEAAPRCGAGSLSNRKKRTWRGSGSHSTETDSKETAKKPKVTLNRSTFRKGVSRVNVPKDPFQEEAKPARGKIKDEEALSSAKTDGSLQQSMNQSELKVCSPFATVNTVALNTETQGRIIAHRSIQSPAGKVPTAPDEKSAARNEKKVPNIDTDFQRDCAKQFATLSSRVDSNKSHGESHVSAAPEHDHTEELPLLLIPPERPLQQQQNAAKVSKEEEGIVPDDTLLCELDYRELIGDEDNLEEGELESDTDSCSSAEETDDSLPRTILSLDGNENESERAGKLELITRYLCPGNTLNFGASSDDQDEVLSILAPSEASFLDSDFDLESERDAPTSYYPNPYKQKHLPTYSGISPHPLLKQSLTQAPREDKPSSDQARLDSSEDGSQSEAVQPATFPAVEARPSTGHLPTITTSVGNSQVKKKTESSTIPPTSATHKEPIQPPTEIPPWTLARFKRKQKEEAKKNAPARKSPLCLPAGIVPLNSTGLTPEVNLSTIEKTAKNQAIGAAAMLKLEKYEILMARIKDCGLKSDWKTLGDLYWDVRKAKGQEKGGIGQMFQKCFSLALYRKQSLDHFKIFLDQVFQGRASLIIRDERNIAHIGVCLIIACRKLENWEQAYSLLRLMKEKGIRYKSAATPNMPKAELLFLAVEICMRSNNLQAAIQCLEDSRWTEPKVGKVSERRIRASRIQLFTEILDRLLPILQDSSAPGQRQTALTLNRMFSSLLSTSGADRDMVPELVDQLDAYGLYETLLQYAITVRDVDFGLHVFSLPIRYKHVNRKPGPAIYQKFIRVVYEASERDAGYLDKAARLAYSASEGPGKLYPWQQPFRTDTQNQVLLSAHMASYEIHLVIHGYLRNMHDKFIGWLEENKVLPESFYKVELKLVDTNVPLALVERESGSLHEAHERIRAVLKNQLKPPLCWEDCNLCSFNLSGLSVKSYLQCLYERLRAMKAWKTSQGPRTTGVRGQPMPARRQNDHRKKKSPMNREAAHYEGTRQSALGAYNYMRPGEGQNPQDPRRAFKGGIPLDQGGVGPDMRKNWPKPCSSGSAERHGVMYGCPPRARGGGRRNSRPSFVQNCRPLFCEQQDKRNRPPLLTGDVRSSRSLFGEPPDGRNIRALPPLVEGRAATRNSHHILGERPGTLRNNRASIGLLGDRPDAWKGCQIGEGPDPEGQERPDAWKGPPLQEGTVTDGRYRRPSLIGGLNVRNSHPPLDGERDIRNRSLPLGAERDMGGNRLALVGAPGMIESHPLTGREHNVMNMHLLHDEDQLPRRERAQVGERPTLVGRQGMMKMHPFPGEGLELRKSNPPHLGGTEVRNSQEIAGRPLLAGGREMNNIRPFLGEGPELINQGLPVDSQRPMTWPEIMMSRSGIDEPELEHHPSGESSRDETRFSQPLAASSLNQVPWRNGRQSARFARHSQAGRRGRGSRRYMRGNRHQSLGHPAGRGAPLPIGREHCYKD